MVIWLIILFVVTFIIINKPISKIIGEQKNIEEYNNNDIRVGSDLRLTYEGWVSINVLNKLFCFGKDSKFIDALFITLIKNDIYYAYTYVYENEPYIASNRWLRKEDVIVLFQLIEGYDEEKEYVLGEINKKINRKGIV